MDKSQFSSTQSVLTSAIQELEAFTYSVSHDLRAPLQYIIGFVDLLKKHLGQVTPPDEKALRYIQIIQEASTRMAKMLEGLLELSRLGREQKKETVSIEKLVVTLQKEWEEKTKDRNIYWKIGKLPPIHGDPPLLQTLLNELINNALKFTRPQKKAVLEIGAISNPKDSTVFFVRDNGVGFDSMYINKLFAPFQRLHSQEEFEGIGLGLAKVQKIIRLHGGKVWAEGAKNKGATFYFSLPG